MRKRKPSPKEDSSTLKVIGTSAAILLVAGAMGIPLQVVAAGVLGAALAVKFT